MQRFHIFLILFAILRIIFCLVDGFEAMKMHRRKKYLLFPPLGSSGSQSKLQLIIGLGLPMEGDVSLIIGYVMKFNYILPYNVSHHTEPYIRYDRSVESDQNFLENFTDSESEGPTSRWEIYKTLESAQNIFDSGRACLLRAICESAESPFKEGHGLMGEFLHVFLTPSTTSEEYANNSDQEYRAAESMGRESPGNCGEIFAECITSPLEYFTEIIH